MPKSLYMAHPNEILNLRIFISFLFFSYIFAAPKQRMSYTQNQRWKQRCKKEKTSIGDDRIFSISPWTVTKATQQRDPKSTKRPNPKTQRKIILCQFTFYNHVDTTKDLCSIHTHAQRYGRDQTIDTVVFSVQFFSVVL